MRFWRHGGIYQSDVGLVSTQTRGRSIASRQMAPDPSPRTRREERALLIVPLSPGPQSALRIAVGMAIADHPPAQIRTSGITAYGSSLGYERRSEHQDKDEEYVDEESTDRRWAAVVPSQASAADSDDVERAASSGRAALENARAQPGFPAQCDNGNSRPPPASATFRQAPLAHAFSGATPA